MKFTAAPAGAGGQRLTAAADAVTVPAGRRAARVSAGLWAALVLAAFAGAALTILGRGNLKASDLVPNLGTAVAVVAYATLGALIVRRAGNLIGWLMLGEGAGLAFLNLASMYAVLGVATFPGALPAAKVVGTAAEASFAGVAFLLAFMVFLFPTGKLPSRRWRPVAAAGFLLAGLSTIGLVLRPRLVQLPGVGGISLIFQNPLGVARLLPVLRVVLIGTISGVSAVFVAFLAVAFVSLAVRYRTGSRLLRQQVKWLALAAVAFVICMAIALLFTGASPSWLTGIAYTAVAAIVFFGIPAAMTVAILRHRLYDIDRVISRTLEYAIVTGLLVGVYAGLVLLATAALPVSLSTPVAVAVATLAAAALFSPLRRRVQRIVDRRFNRARYDAESTVAAFAARLKDTVDLDSVRDDLAGVVHQALEPAHVSVWIRPYEGDLLWLTSFRPPRRWSCCWAASVSPRLCMPLRRWAWPITWWRVRSRRRSWPATPARTRRRCAGCCARWPAWACSPNPSPASSR